MSLDTIHVALNTLDDPSRGSGGMYLTVLGTSADGADGGQVGRGNRVNGLISLHRPMSTEAAAGKNPVSHVGKIYNVLAHQIAARLCTSVPGIEEATVWLCSQIGRPLAEPWSIAVELHTQPGMYQSDLEHGVQRSISDELQNLPVLVEHLTRGELSVCYSPSPALRRRSPGPDVPPALSSSIYTFDICDRLETQLAATQTTSSKLLEAVLHEAIAT